MITTDQGQEFYSLLMNNFFEWLGIRRIITTLYNPRANGELKRRWRTLNTFVAIHSITYQDTLDLLPRAVFMINTTPHDITMQTPSYLMFSYIPSTPTIYRGFTPENLKGTERKAIDKEKEKIKLLELAKTSLMNKAI